MNDRGKMLLCLAVLVGLCAAAVSICPTKAEASKASSVEAEAMKVEAFLVEVELDELNEEKKSGKLGAVCISTILELLKDDDDARVVSGVSLSLLDGVEGQVFINSAGKEEHEGEEDDDDEESDDDDDDDDDSDDDEGDHDDDDELLCFENSFRGLTKFIACASLFTAEDIEVRYEFFQELAHEEETEEDDEESENSYHVERQWSGGTILRNGKPSVVASASNDDTAVFLILRGDIIE